MMDEKREKYHEAEKRLLRIQIESLKKDNARLEKLVSELTTESGLAVKALITNATTNN